MFLFVRQGSACDCIDHVVISGCIQSELLFPFQFRSMVAPIWDNVGHHSAPVGFLFVLFFLNETIRVLVWLEPMAAHWLTTDQYVIR